MFQIHNRYFCDQRRTVSSPNSCSPINPTLSQSASSSWCFFYYLLPIVAASHGKKTLGNLWLIASVILCAAGSARAQTCCAMSLGNGSSLIGFVPFPSTNAWNPKVAPLTPDPNTAAIVAARPRSVGTAGWGRFASGFVELSWA